jgi:hypothetical protein
LQLGSCGFRPCLQVHTVQNAASHNAELTWMMLCTAASGWGSTSCARAPPGKLTYWASLWMQCGRAALWWTQVKDMCLHTQQSLFSMNPASICGTAMCM